MESKGRPGMGDMREESALNMFRQMDLKGKTKDDTQLKTVHQNTIATIRAYEDANGDVRKFSSKLFGTARIPEQGDLTPSS
jgi:actin related protein 2/3 complex subunit 1A/1B